MLLCGVVQYLKWYKRAQDHPDITLETTGKISSEVQATV